MEKGWCRAMAELLIKLLFPLNPGQSCQFSVSSQGQGGPQDEALAWAGTRTRMPAHPLPGPSHLWLLLLLQGDPAEAGTASVLGVQTPSMPSSKKKLL